MTRLITPVWLLLLSASFLSAEQSASEPPALWSLRPLVRPEIPAGSGRFTNPIDAFTAAIHREKRLQAAGRAEKATLLRRVYFDLIGLPPTPAELDAFLRDESSGAYEKAVDRLLADPQHGVRYARHWLDVLRYADVDGAMVAENGIHLWREWVIGALNRDTPYDEFVRAQVAGDLSSKPDDLFATGFLARAALSANDAQEEIAFMGAEVVSSAFLAMTTGCARCHDHMVDPISQRDYYRMKALFDPLVPKKNVLATADEIFANARALEKWEKDAQAIQARMDQITNPYYPALFAERLLHLPPDAAAIYRKPAGERTPEEQKLADNYEPNVRIDPRKYRDVMTADETQRYEAIRKGLVELKRDPPGLPVFWSVAVSPERLARKSYVYTGGDRSKKGEEVQPGFPFAPKDLKFEGDRRQVFLRWLTAPENPLFARVVMNRIWQWHFGEGISATPNDFGTLGEQPVNARLLDWLASEFLAQKYSMKAMHRLIVTSETYRRSSAIDPAISAANQKIDPKNKYLWKYPLRRLEAEPVRDAVLFAAGDLDLSIGGKSFRGDGIEERRGASTPRTGNYDERRNRRAIYMGRGQHSSMNMMPAFLEIFNAEDGQFSCARRNHTLTAPQVLFLLNSELTHEASKKLAERLRREAAGDPKSAVDLGYRIALSRPPSGSERDHAMTYLNNDAQRLEGFAWMLLNLSEFVFIK
jgi:hypothetical protein